MGTFKRILMTGHNGYIGSVMAPVFLQAGYEVIGLDTGYFRQCTFVPDLAAVPSIEKDIRDVAAADLEGIDAIVHLAALSNDPLGNLNGRWTEEINLRGSVRLAELAKAAGVRRFLFSSSCIMYGMSDAEVVAEGSPLDPRTEYARSKAEGERAIAALAGGGFAPVFLPVLEAPSADVDNQTFNAGADHLNVQVIDLARIVARTVPGCELEVLAQPGADQRTYKADFRKFADAFPNFRFRWTPEDGAREVYEAFTKMGLSRDVFLDKRFTRIKWLEHLLTAGRLD